MATSAKMRVKRGQLVPERQDAREQRQYLHRRLTDAHSDVKWAPDFPVPANVQRAQKIVKAHDRFLSRLRDKHKTIVTREERKVREAIYFADPDKALAAVKRFEEFTARIKRNGKRK